MAGKFEVIVGLVDKADKGAGVTNSGALLVDQFNTDKSGFSLVNQGAQTGVTVIAAVTSVVQLTTGFVPLLNMHTNAVAGTMMFLKITAQYKSDQEFNQGDVVSLVGNVAGVAAGVTLLVAGAGLATTGFVAVGVVTSLYSVVSSDAINKLFNVTVLPIWDKYFKSAPDATFPAYWIAPDLKLVPLTQIIASYADRIAANHWDPATHAVTLSSVTRDEYGSNGSGAAGEVNYGGGGGAPPLVIPTPDYPVGNIDISIESIGGKPVSQDSYGCCTGSQDGYY